MDMRRRSAVEVAEEQLGPLSREQVRRIADAGLDARDNAVYHAWGVPALSTAQLDEVERVGRLNAVADMMYEDHMRRIRDRRSGAVAPVSGGAPEPELRPKADPTVSGHGSKLPEPELKPKTPVKEPHGTARLTLTINGQHYQVKLVECQAAGASRCIELKKPGTAGTTYHIAVFPYGVECDCPDFIYRREGTATACKHCAALRVFGLIDAEPAVAKARPKAPEAAPVKMTREALTSGKVRHPFDLAGLGPGPFVMFATLRNLDSEITRKSAALMHVGTEACAACRLPSDTLYVVEGLSGKRHAVCPTCITKSGDGGLIRRMTHEEHERRRLLDSISTDRRRK